MIKRLYILAAILLCGNVYSQQIEEKIEIIFDLDGYEVESTAANIESTQRLRDMMQRVECDSLFSVTAIKVDSYASPEGDKRYNKRLTERRSESIHSYLRDEVSIPDSLITTTSQGIAWGQLRDMVMESDMPWREDVAEIIDNIPEESWQKLTPNDIFRTLVDSRNKHLMDLRGGVPYRYMQKNFFPTLRTANIVTVYYNHQSDPISRGIEFAQSPIPTTNIAPLAVESVAMDMDNDKEPLKFALKTNLLYDLMLVPSIELEIPIKERWSVAGEWICPWWVTKDNGYALQILSGQLEGRYWFGDRTNRAQLTGWFAGFYAGGGYYDLQWKNNGYQGEFYIAAGLAGGYAHTINKRGNLRMEYSLGVGYMSTKYRYYEGQQDNEYLVWQHDGDYTWIGPTKAKVSLVWFINWERGGKR